MFFNKKEKIKFKWDDYVGKKVLYSVGYHCEDFIGFVNSPIIEGMVDRCLGDCVKIDRVWHTTWKVKFYGVL